jgi:predicted dehydrogenase
MDFSHLEQTDGRPFSRRRFLAKASQGILAGSFLGLANSQDAQASSVEGSANLKLPPTEAESEGNPSSPTIPIPAAERVGFAIVGLGNLALQQILPAFGASQLARPVALVSGSPDKAKTIGHRYGISERAIYNYENFDRIKENPDVQAVYVVLPNSMHHEFVLRAAQAGKHVLCEKPMAISTQQCAEMIAACQSAGKKLMIAYRIQYEPHHRMVQKLVRSGQYGPIKMFESVNGQVQGDPLQWRLKKAMSGGGALPDIGLYCLNSIRFLLGEEPIEILGQTFSTPNDPRFTEVEENIIFQLRFPSGALANCASGYGFHESRRYRIHGSLGWIEADPAYAYEGLRIRSSLPQKSSTKEETFLLEPKNQFALELDHLAGCILEDRQPYTSGEEGLQDQTLIEAIYQSARKGASISFPSSANLGLDPFRHDPPPERG